MMRLGVPTALAAISLACGVAPATADEFGRIAGETDEAFARRALQLSEDADAHAIAASWNGVPTVFADFETSDDEPKRVLVALQQRPSGTYRRVQVTVGEQEGGAPEIVAVGFANADRDAAKEVIVILRWEQRHLDVNGSLFEVRIFDDPKTDETSLTRLKVSNHFGFECDCSWSDGTRKRFRFKTIAAVKAELRRLGF